jgi:hypothetical protein
VLFVGYSMRDLNIRMLLHRIWETWAGSRYEAHRPKSFIFMPRANPVQQSVLARWGITLLTGNSDDPEAALTEFLQELRDRAERDPRSSGASTLPAAEATGTS